MIVRGGKDGEGVIIAIWKGSRMIKEIHVPKDLHGSVYNDNWFCKEPSWNAEETRIAYVAEVATILHASVYCKDNYGMPQHHCNSRLPLQSLL